MERLPLDEARRLRDQLLREYDFVRYCEDTFAGNPDWLRFRDHVKGYAEAQGGDVLAVARWVWPKFWNEPLRAALFPEHVPDEIRWRLRSQLKASPFGAPPRPLKWPSLGKYRRSV